MALPSTGSFPIFKSSPIHHLTEPQIASLTRCYQRWFDESLTRNKRKIRGRYWIAFLFLRFTGARIGEVLKLDDSVDINFREAEVRLVTLKRRKRSKRNQTRIVPVPHSVIAELATYIAEFPEQRGRVFKLDQGNFRRVFYQRAKEAGIPKELSHPHILRHTRAIELLRAGVPVTVVQDILGHSSLTTTAVYLKISGWEAKEILKERGLI